MVKKRWFEYSSPGELYEVSSEVRTQFSTQTAKKIGLLYQNLLFKYSIPALLMLGLIGIKLAYTVFIVYLVGSSPLTSSGNYSIIFGGFILVLLIFGGAFIGIALRKIIGALLCLLGVIMDLVVRVFTINELLTMIEEFYDLDLIMRLLKFEFLDYLLISLFLVSAFYTIKAFRSNNQKKLWLKKLCKNCSKFIADATPGFCPHCGHLISS